MDEIAYRKGRRFLTIVTDHDAGHVVWIHEGRTQTALITFLDTLGPAGRNGIKAISMDMARIYREAARIYLPQAAICYDPFHLIKVRHEAPCIRVGCKDPPPGCRSSPVKLAAA